MNFEGVPKCQTHSHISFFDLSIFPIATKRSDKYLDEQYRTSGKKKSSKKSKKGKKTKHKQPSSESDEGKRGNMPSVFHGFVFLIQPFSH